MVRKITHSAAQSMHEYVWHVKWDQGKRNWRLGRSNSHPPNHELCLTSGLPTCWHTCKLSNSAIDPDVAFWYDYLSLAQMHRRERGIFRLLSSCWVAFGWLCSPWHRSGWVCLGTGDFLRPPRVLPPSRGWVHCLAPEAPLIREMPMGPKVFLAMLDVCGLWPCDQTHLQNGLVCFVCREAFWVLVTHDKRQAWV